MDWGKPKAGLCKMSGCFFKFIICILVFVSRYFIFDELFKIEIMIEYLSENFTQVVFLSWVPLAVLILFLFFTEKEHHFYRRFNDYGYYANSLKEILISQTIVLLSSLIIIIPIILTFTYFIN